MDDCTVVWNGEEYRVPGHTVAQVMRDFLSEHKDLATQGLALFSMGGLEMRADDVVWPDEQYVLRPAVIH